MLGLLSQLEGTIEEFRGLHLVSKYKNLLMKGDAKPVFTRYDDGRPAENLFNKEGKDYLTLLWYNKCATFITWNSTKPLQGRKLKSRLDSSRNLAI